MKTRIQFRSASLAALSGALLFAAGMIPIQAAVTLLNLDATLGVEEAPGDPAENGDAVSRWLDQGGLGNNANGAGTPTYSTTDHLGAPAVVFDSGSDRFTVPTLGLSSSSNYFISARIKGSGAGERVIASTYNAGSGPTSGFSFYLYNKSLNFYANGFSVDSSSSGNLALRYITDDTWTDVAVEKDGNLYRLFINGQESFANTSSVSWGGGVPLEIGSAFYGTSAFGSFANLSITAIPEPSIAAMSLLGTVLVWRRRSRLRAQ
jgi:hypothetical protein